MIRQLMFAAAAAALGTSGAARDAAANLPPTAEVLAIEAKKVQVEAQDISRELRARQFDLDKVKGMTGNLTAHVESVNRIVAELESMQSAMTGQQRTTFEQVKVKAQLLTIFATNKQDVVLGNQPEKNRSLLRAKAEGIARRAQLLQQSATALRR